MAHEPDPTWTNVDHYLERALFRSDKALEGALTASVEAGLPPIQVAPNQGKLLALWAQTIRARTILEIGTLGGYSTIWLARTLPAGGKLTTLELDPKHAAVARANFERAGVSDRIELRVGRALDILPLLAAESPAAFDFVFIDADKQSIPEYFDWSLKLAHPGSVIVVDNVIRRGAVADPNTTDAAVRGVQRFIEQLANEPRVSGTIVQTVGSKGYDGFAYLLVTS